MVISFSINGVPSENLKRNLLRLKRTQLIVRDPLSFQRLETTGVKNITLAGDVAFLLNSSPVSDLPQHVRDFFAALVPVVGINVTDVVFGKDVTGEERLRHFADSLVLLSERVGCRFVFSAS